MDFWSEPTTKEKKGYSHHTNSRKRKKSPYPLLCYWYFSSIVLKNQRKRSWHPDQTGREREGVSPPHPLLLIVDRSSPGSLLYTLDTTGLLCNALSALTNTKHAFSVLNLMHFICICCAEQPVRISWFPRHLQYNGTEYQYGTLFLFICSWYFPSRWFLDVYATYYISLVLRRTDVHCITVERIDGTALSIGQCVCGTAGGRITQWGIRKKHLGRTDSTDVIYTFQIKDVNT